MKIKSLALLCFLTLSCQHTPKFNKTVDSLDLEGFMGTWYVQAGRFTPFETDVFNSIEKYTWDKEGEKIQIEFKYNKGGPNGEVKSFNQVGRIYNEQTKAHWKVSPFWFLQFDFLVIALDEKSQWTAIGVPNQKYLWIMSRDPNFSEAQLADALREVKKIGYDISNLTTVEHPKN